MSRNVATHMSALGNAFLVGIVRSTVRSNFKKPEPVEVITKNVSTFAANLPEAPTTSTGTSTSTGSMKILYLVACLIFTSLAVNSITYCFTEGFERKQRLQWKSFHGLRHPQRWSSKMHPRCSKLTICKLSKSTHPCARIPP
jgi:hypothetical protein